MENKEILGVKINNISKKEFLDNVYELSKNNKVNSVVTPYSEFFVIANKDEKFKELLNSSDLSIADGVGVKLALKYKSMKGIYVPMFKCLASLLVYPKFFEGTIKEKLSGSDMIYELCKMAALRDLKVFFLGGFDFGRGNTGRLAAEELKRRNPRLKVSGIYDGDCGIDDDESVKRINTSKSDLVFVAYGPKRQEEWVERNRKKLKPCVCFGLGGSFDFVSGEKARVPQWLVGLGLEGVFRPFWSEWRRPKLIVNRISRGWTGMYRFTRLLINEKKKNLAR